MAGYYAEFNKALQQINFEYPLTINNNAIITGTVGIGSTLTTSNVIIQGDLTLNGTINNGLLRISRLGVGTTIDTNYSITVASNISLNVENLTTQNKLIKLYETAVDNHQFSGFGINTNVMRYQIPNTSTAHVFYTGTSSTTSSELMRIQGNGYVGIGTTVVNTSHTLTTPSIRLNNENAATNKLLTLYDTVGTNTHQFIGFGVSGAGLRYQVDSSTNHHIFQSGIDAVSSKELVRFDGNGNVSIGYGASPGYLLTLGSGGAGFPSHTGGAPMYAARAWAMFNGTNGTIAQQRNITSTTRNATGDFTITITTPLPTGTFSALCSTSLTTTNVITLNQIFSSPFTVQAPSTTSFRITTTNISGAVADPRYVSFVVFAG